jgi:hypothetical protein
MLDPGVQRKRRRRRGPNGALVGIEQHMFGSQRIPKLLNGAP